MQAKLQWSGYLVRMYVSGTLKALFYGELRQGVRTIRSPRKRFKYSLKSVSKACDIDPGKWGEVALGRPAWRSVCYKGTASFESVRITSLKERRQRRNVKCSSFSPKCTTSVTDGGFHYGRCQRVCGSRIGLSSPLRRWHTRQDVNGT